MISSQLRDQVIEFIDGHQSPRELEDWIVPRLEYFLQKPHTRDAELVTAVELGLVELGQGTLTEDDLRLELSDEIQRDISILVQGRQSETLATSVSKSQEFPSWGPQPEASAARLTFLPS
jgi:hypothetical protein